MAVRMRDLSSILCCLRPSACRARFAADLIFANCSSYSVSILALPDCSPGAAYSWLSVGRCQRASRPNSDGSLCINVHGAALNLPLPASQPFLPARATGPGNRHTAEMQVRLAAP